MTGFFLKTQEKPFMDQQLTGSEIKNSFKLIFHPANL
jgi:hypothetical protein